MIFGLSIFFILESSQDIPEMGYRIHISRADELKKYLVKGLAV